MSTNITYAGVTYTIPAIDDVDWGEQVTAFLVAIPSGMLTKTGGSWPIGGAGAADLDFGTEYGLVSKYYKSKTATIAGGGFIRMAKTDAIAWRDNTNSSDSILIPNANNEITWRTVALVDLSSSQALSNKTIDAASNTITNITNSEISASAGIEWSKLSVADGDILWTKVNSTGQIKDADIASDAAISASKIDGDFGPTAIITAGGVKLGTTYKVTLIADPSEDYDFEFPDTDGLAGQALVKSVGGGLEWASVPGLALNQYHIMVGNSSNLPTEVDTNLVGDIKADETNGLTIKSGTIVNADINASAGIDHSKMAAITASRALVSDGSGVVIASSTTAAEIGYISGLTSAVQTQLNDRVVGPASAIDSDIAVFDSTTGKLIKDGGKKLSDLALASAVSPLTAIITDTKEPMGLVTLPSAPTVTYLGTRQIKIAHPFSYYYKGTKFSSSADVTVTVTNTTGLYYIVFTDANGTATATTSPDILNQVIWSAFYWNASTSDYMFFNELHGTSWTANEHKQAHLTRGAAYESGGAASGYVLNSDLLVDVQIALDAVAFWDEDIRLSQAARLEGDNWDKWYRSGASGDWIKAPSDTIPAFHTLNVPRINTISGTWQLTAVTANYYFNVYIFGTNSAETANRFIIIPGQSQSSTLAGAQALSVANLSLGSLPVQEILPLYKVTLQYKTSNTNNDARVTIQAIEDIRRTQSPGVSAGVSGLHNSLSGRSDADAHPPSAITGTAVTLAGAEALTNKDIDGGTASNSNRITAPKNTKANLEGLTRKEATIVYATDTKTLYVDDGSALQAVGSGSGTSSEINYISNFNFGQTVNGAVPAGWATYADAAGATPVDGTGGSPNVTFLASTTSPIRGLVSAVLTKDAANRQGEGVAYAFTIDAVDKGKKIGINFDITPGGSYVDGDVAVYVYDVTNSALLTPSATSVPNAIGTFTTSFDLTAGTSYRFILHVASTNASAWTLKVDNVSVGYKPTPQGAVVQQPLTLTGMTASGVAAGYSINAKYTRIGNKATIEGVLGLNGANTTNVVISLPSSITIDQSMLSPGILGGQAYQVIGEATFRDATNSNLYFYQVVVYIATNAFYFIRGNGTPDGITNTLPIAAEAGDTVEFKFTVPIAEWAGSGTVNLAQNDVEFASNSYSTGDNAGTYLTAFSYGPSGSLIPNGAVGTTYQRRVQFQSPIQVTDKISIEVDRGSNGAEWIDMSQIFPVHAANGKAYGVDFIPVSTTQVDVYFSSGGRSAYSAATYGANGGPWSDVSTWRWRVRKTSAGAAVGFGIVSENSSGLFPAYNTNLDNATATRLGLKQYLHGTTYNGGNAPTVGGTGVTPARGSFVPYQLQDGSWRMRINIAISHSGMTAGNSYQISINGVTFIDTYYQNLSAIAGGAAPYTCSSNTAISSGNINIYPATNSTFAQVSGDVELVSKPTWAY